MRDTPQNIKTYVGDLDAIVFEDELHANFHQLKEEFDAAEPKSWDELTDEELAEMKEDEAEVNRQIRRNAELAKIRNHLMKGIKLKADAPESELYRTAEKLLDILDRYEADPSCVSDMERRKYKTGRLKYDALLETENKNHPEPRPAEGPEDIPGEYRTSPMSQTELANLYGGDMTQKKIRAMIDSGTLRVIEVSRQKFIFDKRQLPPHVKEKLEILEQS